MPCSVKDYIEREKRLIDISILAGCHVLLMKSPPRHGIAFSKRKEIVFTHIELDQTILESRRRFEIAHRSFVRSLFS